MNTKPMLLLTAWLAASAGSVSAATYSFTNVLDSTGDFAFFYHCAAINSAGVVAFHAERDSGVKGIYRRNGSTTTTIVDDSSGDFSFHPVPRFLESRPAMDDDGTVAFFIYHRVSEWDYAPSVRTGNGSTTTLIAESSATGTFYDAFSNPAIRNGVVSFRGGLNAPPNDPWGAFTTPASGGSYASVAQSGSQFTGFGETSINSGGQVAFQADLTNGASGIFVGLGGATTIAQTGDGSQFEWLDVLPKISDNGTVVFHAELTNLTYGCFIGSGGAVTQITVAGGGEAEDDIYPSINSAGTVVCLGRLASNARAVLAGTGAVLEKVIAEGDPLFGSTVISLGEPGSHGLNNNGQIVFKYSLENGVEGIAIATPGTSSETAGPRLQIERLDSLQMRISWPAPAEGWVLEVTNALPPVAVASWPQVPEPYQTNAGIISVTLTNTPAVGNQFFRLHKP